MTDSPRTRSSDRALPGYGFRSDSSPRKKDGFQGSRNPGRDGRGRERLYDPVAFHVEHFPEQRFGAVQAAAYAESAMHHHREYPAPAAVRERMVERGWLVSDGEERDQCPPDMEAPC